MSGVGDYGERPEGVTTPEMTKEVMKLFNVDKKTAERIISYCTVCAHDRMEKWKRNWKKIQKEKAGDIYKLFRNVKRGRVDKPTIDEIEQKILELCVER